MDPQSNIYTVDLTGLVSPFCQLKLKSELSRLRKGAELMVIIGDPQLIGPIEQIIGPSKDEILQLYKDNSGCQVKIIKG